jgi:phage shock protein C
MKKLYRSKTDKVIAGVLGGFAEYVEVDSTVVRLGYVLITLLSCFAGILFYIIAWIIIPKKVSHETKHDHTHKESKNEAEDKSDVSQESKSE